MFIIFTIDIAHFPPIDTCLPPHEWWLCGLGRGHWSAGAGWAAARSGHNIDSGDQRRCRGAATCSRQMLRTGISSNSYYATSALRCIYPDCGIWKPSKTICILLYATVILDSGQDGGIYLEIPTHLSSFSKYIIK